MTPSEEPKIIRLPRNGPKPGQSTSAWLYGKQRAEDKALEQQRWNSLRKNDSR
jgi:hypothetical protein